MSIECVLLCLGDLLIIMAQIIVATQMVYEQKFVMRYNVPALQAVGWEGMPCMLDKESKLNYFVKYF